MEKHEVQAQFIGKRFPSGRLKYRYAITGLPADFNIEDQFGIFIEDDQVCVDSLSKVAIENHRQLEEFDATIVQREPDSQGRQFWNLRVTASRAVLLAQLEEADSIEQKSAVAQRLTSRKVVGLGEA